MGAFDILVIAQKCEECGNLVQKRFQFKYGTPWQKEFVLGDEVRWEGRQTDWNGQPMPGLIALDAEIEECPSCAYEYDFSVVYVDDGKFIGAGRNNGRFHFGVEDYAISLESHFPQIPLNE